MSSRMAFTMVAILLSSGLALAVRSPASEGDAPSPQELFVEVHKCNTCHGVAAAGIEAKSEKMESIDLGGYTTDDLAALGQFLRREVEHENGKHKKPFKGSDKELAAIVQWLGSVDPEPED